MPALFDIPERASKSDDKALIQKSKKKSTSKIASKGNYDISTICATVEKYLGKYADEMEVIQDEQLLSDYIDKAITNGFIAIDTETTGLDPLKDDLVGISLYTPGEKSVYIPIGHVSHVTGVLVKSQLSKDVVGRILKRLVDAGTKNILFNAVFDIRFIKRHCGVRLSCWWDCYIASRCLNENEPNKGLKKLHQKYVLKGEEDAFKFDDLFKGKNFALIPIKTAYLYAAHDSKITWEYFEYQRQFLYYDPSCTSEDRNGMNGVSWVFFNIEMPCIDAVVDMEDTGIAFDMEYNAYLKDKYHKLLNERVDEFNRACKAYADKISEYSGKVTLDNPININSVPQLQVLLYDIVGLEAIDKRTKEPTRSTSEETLKKLNHPIVDAILSYRELSTIVSTFIDKLPACVNPADGRIHCKFNQYGADTGRFSSQDPNMQNIPSHNKDIRKMFKAHSEEYTVSTDTDYLELKRFTEVETPNGWVYSDKLKIGDELLMVDDDGESVYSIDDIKILPDKVIIKLFDCSQ